jgi:hypothetical protein
VGTYQSGQGEVAVCEKEENIKVMTIDEVADLGKQLLVEYEGRLKVYGVKKFDRTSEKIAQRVECNLDNVQADEIKPVIRSVLDGLAGVGDFVMSEPEFTEPMVGAELRNVVYKGLRLTFTYGAAVIPIVSGYLWISCWCYPSPRSAIRSTQPGEAES